MFSKVILSESELSFIGVLRNGLNRSREEIIKCSVCRGFANTLNSNFNDTAESLLKKKYIAKVNVYGKTNYKITGKGERYMNRHFPVNNVY